MGEVKSGELSFSVPVSSISQTDDATSGLVTKDLPFKDLALSGEGQPVLRLENCVFVLYQAEDGAQTARVTFHCEPHVESAVLLKLNLNILDQDHKELDRWAFELSLSAGDTKPLDLEHKTLSKMAADSARQAELSISF